MVTRGVCPWTRLLVLLLLAGLEIVPARAEPVRSRQQQAKVHLERGLVHYKAGRYLEAIDEFQAGYALDPNPDFLYALGQAERNRGNCRKAIGYYEQILGKVPSGSRAKAVHFQLERCQQELKKSPEGEATALPQQVPRSAEEPRPEPAQEPRAVSPPPAPTSGTGEVQAAAPTRPSTARPTPSTATPASPASPPALSQSPSLVAPTRSTLAVGPSDPKDEPWYKDWVGGIACGLGVASLAVGTVLFVSGNQALGEAGQSYDRYVAAQGAEAKRTGGAVLLGVGGGLLAAGVIRYALRARSSGVATPARAQLSFDLGGSLWAKSGAREALVTFGREF